MSEFYGTADEAAAVATIARALEAQRLHDDAVEGLGHAADHHVDGPGLERADLIGRGELPQRHPDLGVVEAEAPEQRQQQVVQAAVHEPDPQVPGLAPGRPAQRPGCLVQLVEQVVGVVQQTPSGGGEAQWPGAAIQQLDPQLTLQLAQLLAQRRLGDVQPRGRAADVQLLRRRDEVAQVSKLHDRPS